MSTRKLAASLTSGQTAVLRAFSEFGPMDDTPLAIYVHHRSNKAMSTSGIRTRRSELARLRLISVAGVKTLKSGRNAAIHGITARGTAVLAVVDTPAKAAV